MCTVPLFVGLSFSVVLHARHFLRIVPLSNDTPSPFPSAKHNSIITQTAFDHQSFAQITCKTLANTAHFPVFISYAIIFSFLSM